MKTIECSTMYLPFLCNKLAYHPTILAQCILCIEDGVPIAGVIYDGYNGMSISAHIWVEEGRRPSREWYVAIFDYPFRRLCVTKIVGQVAETNEGAHRLDKHFGFVEEARITEYSHEGDLIVYSMTYDQCKILNSPLWEKVSSRVLRVA